MARPAKLVDARSQRLEAAYRLLPRRLILRCSLCPGDIVMLTAAVRDLHRCHPGRFLTDVRTPWPELWEHNPHVTPLREREQGVEIVDCHYPLIHQSNRNPVHFLHGFVDFLSRRLGAGFQLTAPHGDIHLSAAERAQPSLPARRWGHELPYWVIVAGGKRDYTIKWWETRRYQEVVDRFQGRLLFVQVGEATDHHPRLEGVVDLRGRTTLRELLHLVYHAQGVLCPVTLLMHLAAAVGTRPGRPAQRACVVVAGGREPPTWEAYPAHQFIHTVGCLPCCDTAGCWRARTLPLGDGDEKDTPGQRCLDVVNLLPHCMDLISPDEVVRRIEICLAGGQIRYLTAGQAVVVRSALASRARRSPGALHPTRRPRPVITIFALTYGDHAPLIRRCLESIRRRCPRSGFRLVVGANAPSPASLQYLVRLHRAGLIERLHVSPVNLNKSPMMRRMFQGGMDTEFVWWFDDDCYVGSGTALRRRLELARGSPPEIVAWGHQFFVNHEDEFDCGCDLRSWIHAAPWFRGRPLPTWELPPAPAGGRFADVAPADGRWHFLTGANWFARASALKAIDWPDPRLVMQAEDILMGEAIRQQGWSIMNIGPCGVRTPPTPGRGQDKAETMREQIARIAE